LNSIILLRKGRGNYRRRSSEPDSSRKVTHEEEMGVIFKCRTIRTYLGKIIAVGAYPFTCGYSSPNYSPSKSFDNG
jgi:hypothetical protein